MVPFGRSPMFASQIRSVSVEIALQVFTYSVAAAKGALDLVQQRFRLVPLVRQLMHGGLALWFHGVEERSVRESELACRLVTLACTLIRALVPELIAECSRLFGGGSGTMLILLERRIGERHRRACQERNERKSPPARCANESGCRVHDRLPKSVWLAE